MNESSIPDAGMPDARMPVAKMPESMWQAKPWWCQPWSILLTGVAIPTASWLLLHRLWITLPVSAAIALWWLLFLVLVPAQYAAAMKEAMAVGTTGPRLE